MLSFRQVLTTEAPLDPARVSYEPACAADAQALADLRVEAMRESLERVGRFDTERARNRLLQDFCADRTVHVLRAGRRVGFYVLVDEGDGLRLDHLYIRPGHQGKGIGSEVLAKILAEADRSGRRVRLGALKESDANRFYARHGFVLVEQGEFDNYYESRDPGPR